MSLTACNLSRENPSNSGKNTEPGRAVENPGTYGRSHKVSNVLVW